MHAAQPNRPPVRATSGFTLAELLMVIVTMGLVLTFALPRVDTEGYKVNASIRAVSASLNYAQRLAVSLGHDVVVAFDSTNGRLRVHEDADNDGVIDPGERVTATPLEDGVVFSRGGSSLLTYTTGVPATSAINFTRTQTQFPAVIFRRDGSASEGGGFYLNTRKGLAGAKSNWVRAAEIVRSSGRVIWYTYASGAWVQGN